MNQKNSKCAGTYPVRAYTKDDGTKVSAYMRTCGAKHAGSNHPKLDHIVDKMTDRTIDVLNKGDTVLYGGITADAQELAMRDIYILDCIYYVKNIHIFLNCLICFGNV